MRRFSTLNIKQYDKRKMANLHGILHYDQYHDIVYDEKVYEERVKVETQEGKKFYNAFEQSDYFYDIRDELASRVMAGVSEPPEVIGEYEYFNKLCVTGEHTYYSLRRRRLGEKTREEVVFDPQKDQAIPSKYLSTHSLLMTSLNDDQSIIGVVADVKSNELPTGFIKDLQTNRILQDR